MRSLQIRTMSELTIAVEAPLAANAGVSGRAVPEGDPFVAWLDLMEAMEALCPAWPPPDPRPGRDYRL